LVIAFVFLRERRDLPVFYFLQDVIDDIEPFLRLELFLHSPKRNADDVPVMQLRSAIFLA
jgi:hypothetical protein